MPSAAHEPLRPSVEALRERGLVGRRRRRRSRRPRLGARSTFHEPCRFVSTNSSGRSRPSRRACTREMEDDLGLAAPSSRSSRPGSRMSQRTWLKRPSVCRSRARRSAISEDSCRRRSLIRSGRNPPRKVGKRAADRAAAAGRRIRRPPSAPANRARKGRDRDARAPAAKSNESVGTRRARRLRLRGWQCQGPVRSRGKHASSPPSAPDQAR